MIRQVKSLQKIAQPVCHQKCRYLSPVSFFERNSSFEYGFSTLGSSMLSGGSGGESGSRYVSESSGGRQIGHSESGSAV